MLDINFIISNCDEVKANCRKRNCKIDIDNLLQIEKERRKLIYNKDGLRSILNNSSKKGKKPIEEELNEIQKVKKKELELSNKIKELQTERDNMLALIPNMLDKRVPIGDEENAKVLREVGKIKEFDFHPLSHEVIGEALDIIDIKRAVNVAKTRFYVLKNDAVFLRMALIQLFIDIVRDQGWSLISPPVLAKDQTLYTSGYLPFAQKDNFKIEGDNDLSLIGTSEQALVGMHQNEILNNLPILYLGDSMCFRTEAGNYGRDTKGILRVHQFYKLEQIVFCHPNESEKWHLKCLENEESLLKVLDIPYRVVLMNSGDLATPGAIKYDIEAWLPSQNCYREMTSDTNMKDYQCRRGNIRYKVADEKGYPHTISATGFCDRLIVALIENYQQKDGSIEIPNGLVKYMNGKEVI